MGIEVRPALMSDVRPLAATLARAFYDDPVWMWLVPDDTTRIARLTRYFATSTRCQHLAGNGVEVACDGSVVGAAALWDPPGQWKMSAREQLQMAPSLTRAFGRHIFRGWRTGALVEAQHPEEPHWYLAVLGSDPSVRGRGFGHAVVASRLDRCDAERCPAYLESSKYENIPYYERFGFRVVGEISLPHNGPTLWRMWRDPR